MALPSALNRADQPIRVGVPFEQSDFDAQAMRRVCSLSYEATRTLQLTRNLLMPIDALFSLQNLVTLFPEIIVLLTVLSILLLDLASADSAWLWKIAVVGLASATFALFTQWGAPPSTSFLGSFQVDTFGTAFRCILTLSCTLCVLLSKEYVERSGMRLAEFLTLALAATLAGMVLCGANDLITIFVSLECLSLPCYLLVGHTKRDVRSNEAAMKYLLMGSASSSILAYGFSLLYALSGGQIQLPQLVMGIGDHLLQPLALWVSLACVLVGLGFKVSAVPFHQWTPDVYEGSPTPVVAFLSVGSKAAVLALATRVLSVVFPVIETEWHLIIQIVSVLTMVFGNLIAVAQTSVKRMLAYSSISQAGYLMIGILCGNAYGYSSMVAYTFIYTFMNLGAFACVITFGLRTGTDQVRDYIGLYLKDPWLALSMSACLLSLAGIPPFAGFFGKLYLFWCGWNSGFYGLIYVAVVTSTISIYYYLRVVKAMVIREVQEMSPYVHNYQMTPLPFMRNNAIGIAITLCVFMSTTLGLAMNPMLATTNQVMLVGSASLR